MTDKIKIPLCPFCKGRVYHTEMDREIKQPDMIQCSGDCFFEIMCSSNDSNTKKGDALKWYLKAFEKDEKI